MRERVYIIPTILGVLLFLVTLMIFVIGALYSNNLVYLMGHLLLSLFICAMILSNSNLKGIRLDFIKSPLFMVSEFGNIEVRLTSEKSENEGIFINFKDHQAHSSPRKIKKHALFEIPVTKNRRGSFQVGKIVIHSTAPFGLFYCWRHINTDALFKVYPLSKNYSVPLTSTSSEVLIGNRNFSKILGDELTYLREFQKGESPFRADWFSLAKGRPLQIREFNSNNDTIISIDLSQMKGLDFEERLSQAVYWIHQAGTLRLRVQFVGQGIYLPERHVELLDYLSTVKEG